MSALFIPPDLLPSVRQAQQPDCALSPLDLPREASSLGERESGPPLVILVRFKISCYAGGDQNAAGRATMDSLSPFSLAVSQNKNTSYVPREKQQFILAMMNLFGLHWWL